MSEIYRNKTNQNRGVFSWIFAMGRELPGYFIPILSFSLVSNILLLVSPLYMLQVYDRILTSGSKDTLIWITLISVFLLAVFAASETGRRKMCNLAAESLEQKLSERIFVQFDKQHDAGGRLPNDLRVLGRIHGFFQNQTILPFFDLPFAPLFLLIMFMIHPLIGMLGLVGGLILLSVAVFAEFSTRRTHETSSAVNSKAFNLASGLSRQRSAIVSMGLTTHALSKWRETKNTARELNLKAGGRESGFSALTKAGRQILQILILGAGGALAITQQISPGAIVAGSIILGRALAPIDQIVGSWRGITQARSAWNQLKDSIEAPVETVAFTPLPRPEAQLKLDRLSIAVPGSREALIRPFGFEMNGGHMMAILGSNGCGKTTLLQTLAGAWMPHSGEVALGGRNLHKWAAEDRGQYIGYVPQDVELLPGTVAENISRMRDAEAFDIIEASKKAGAHEIILSLPKGYDTEVGASGMTTLSAGQRQLIGLARALFGSPVLILLDEPTANLDPTAVYKAISHLNKVAQSGVMIIAATHDIKLIQATKSVMVIREGGILNADTKQYLQASKPKVRTNTVQPLRRVGASA
jgi:PrtD family type I secretion system ABC transporter